jgi:hypothetical protein
MVTNLIINWLVQIDGEVQSANITKLLIKLQSLFVLKCFEKIYYRDTLYKLVLSAGCFALYKGILIVASEMKCYKEHSLRELTTW